MLLLTINAGFQFHLFGRSIFEVDLTLGGFLLVGREPHITVSSHGIKCLDVPVETFRLIRSATI
ncbi:hypothetical protein D9M71_444770 [compost metagenome]